MQTLSSLLRERVSALISASPGAQEALRDTDKISELQAERSALLDQVYELTQRLKEQEAATEDQRTAQENLSLRAALVQSRSSGLDVDSEGLKSLRDTLSGSKSELESIKLQRDKYIERSRKLENELEFSEERFLNSKAFRFLLKQAKELRRQLLQAKTRIEELTSASEQARKIKSKEFSELETAEAGRREGLEVRVRSLVEELERCTEAKRQLEGTVERLQIELGQHKHATHFLQLIEEGEAEIKRLKSQLISRPRPEAPEEDLQKALQNERATNEILMEELEVTGKAYAEVTRKSKMLMGQLQEQEQNYARMMKERLEEAGPRLAVQQENALLLKQVAALKTVLEKSEALVSAESDRVKTLESDMVGARQAVLLKQIGNLEDSFTSFRKSQEEVFRDREALQRAKTEARDAVVALEARLTEETTKRAQEQEERLNLEAAYESAKRELRDQSSLDGLKSTDELLNAEVDKFRVRTMQKMVRCGVCSTRAKEVVLTKCFHAFCRTCIERNLELRKRQCPTCMTKYGQEDVKTFWWK
jgi:E3 ubiquitin-protein ligase BRE1